MVQEFKQKRKSMFYQLQSLQQANFGQTRGVGELASSLQSWHVILKIRGSSLSGSFYTKQVFDCMLHHCQKHQKSSQIFPAKNNEMIMLNKENKGIFVFGSCVLSLSFRGSSFSLQPSSPYGFQFSFFYHLSFNCCIFFRAISFLFGLFIF